MVSKVNKTPYYEMKYFLDKQNQKNQKFSLLKEVTPPHCNSVSTPGLLSCLTAPYELASYSNNLRKSPKDRHNVSVASFKIIGAPPRFFYGLGTVSSTIAHFTKLPSPILYSMGFFPCGYLGILSCLIEGIFQSVHIGTKIYFKQNLYLSWLKQLKEISLEKDPIQQLERMHVFLQEKATKEIFKEKQTELVDEFQQLLPYVEHKPEDNHFLFEHFVKETEKQFLFNQFKDIENKYFKFNVQTKKELKNLFKNHSKKALKEKIRINILSQKRKLADRVSPIMVQELEKKLPDLMKKLDNSDFEEVAQAIQEGEKILKDMNTQINKAFLVHTLAVISLVLLSISFIALFISFPFITPLLLSLAGLILWIISYVLYRGLLTHMGHYFSIEHVLPEKIKKIWMNRKSPSQSLAS